MPKIQKQQGEVISGGLVDGVVKDISQKIEKNFGRRARGVDQALESALKGKTFSNIEQFQKSILAVLKTLEIPANPKDVKGVKEADLFREEMEGREYITLDELKMKSQEAITRIAFDATKSKRFNPNLAFFDNEQTKKRDAINLEDVQRRQIESVVDIVPDNLVEIVGDAIAQDLDADTIASLSVPERQVLANALDAVQQVGTNNVVSSNIQQLAGTGIELPDNVVAGLDVPKRAVSREDTTVPTKPTPVPTPVATPKAPETAVEKPTIQAPAQAVTQAAPVQQKETLKPKKRTTGRTAQPREEAVSEIQAPRTATVNIGGQRLRFISYPKGAGHCC